MLKTLHQLWTTLRRAWRPIWDQLTQTTVENPTPEHRFQVKVLAAAVVALLLIQCTLILTGIFDLSQFLYDTRLFFGVLAEATFIVSYLISRTRFYRLAALILLMLNAFIIVSAALILNKGFDLAWLVLIVLAASVMLSLRLAIGVIVANTLIFIGLMQAGIMQNTTTHLSDVLIFFLGVSVFMVLGAWHRNRLEDMRKAQIAEQAAHLRLVLDQTPALIWTADTHLTITSMVGKLLDRQNAPLDKVVGLPVHEMPMIDAARFPLDEMHRRALAGEYISDEYVLGERTYYWQLRPLYDDNRRITGCIGMALDVSERRRAEQQRIDLVAERERVRVLSEFIQNASHDLRTPLATINTSIYLAQKTTDEARRQHHLNVLRKQSEHLAALVEGMLTLSSLDQGANEAAVCVSLRRLLDDLYRHFLPQAEAKSLTFEQRPASVDDDLSILGNEMNLIRAFSNLIVNAINYTPEGGHVQIDTRRENRDVVVAISDTGIGIKSDALPHIFERFYRVDGSRSTQNGGSGLGLAIAQKVIEAHDGTISVSSEPEVGSVFKVALPALEAPQQVETHC